MPEKQMLLTGESVKVRTDFTPEQMQLFKDLLYDTNEVATETFVPFVLFNREKTIFHLKEAKRGIDKLLEMI